jgi:hypothetical protein
MAMTILHTCVWKLEGSGKVYAEMSFHQKKEYLDGLLKQSESRDNPKLLEIGVTQRLLFFMLEWISGYRSPEAALAQMRCPVRVSVDSSWVRFLDAVRKIKERPRKLPPLPADSGNSSDDGVETDSDDETY